MILHSKENKKMKRLPLESKKIFANKSTNKGLISKTDKQFMQVYVKKKKRHNQKGQKIWIDISPNKIHTQWTLGCMYLFKVWFSPNTRSRVGMARKYMKRCSPSLIIREMQIKTTMSYHLKQVRMVIIKKSTSNRCWKGMEKRETFYTVDGNANW